MVEQTADSAHGTGAVNPRQLRVFWAWRAIPRGPCNHQERCQQVIGQRVRHTQNVTPRLCLRVVNSSNSHGKAASELRHVDMPCSQPLHPAAYRKILKKAGWLLEGTIILRGHFHQDRIDGCVDFVL